MNEERLPRLLFSINQLESGIMDEINEKEYGKRANTFGTEMHGEGT